MRPSNPARRSASAARNPASDIPTIATERTPAVLLARYVSVGERDCLGGTDAHCFFDLGAQLLARFLLEHVEEVVVAHFEDLGRGRHAEGVALALVEIDHDPHHCLPARRRRRHYPRLAGNLTGASY